MDSTLHIIKSNIKHILVKFYLRNSNLIRKINELRDIINSLFLLEHIKDSNLLINGQWQ